MMRSRSLGISSMATSSLLSAIQTAFGTAITLGYSSSTAAHDIYEGYILTLFLRAAVIEGWRLQLRDGTGKLTSHVVFRLGPGRLPSRNFTHVHLTRRGKLDLEAHLGVKVIGKAPYVATAKSKNTSAYVVHEFDLLVLLSAAADDCRRFGTDPAHANVVAHAEAKFYGGNLTLPLGRAVVGLAAECDLARKSVLVTNRNGATVQDLIEHYDLDFRFLVTPSGKGESHLVTLFQKFLQAAP